MSNIQNSLDAYYAGWTEGNFDWSIITEDVKFVGPLMQCQGINEFKAMIQSMSQMATVDRFDLVQKFINEEERQACVRIRFHTIAPRDMWTDCADFFSFDAEGRIESLEIVYDAREWEKAMQTAKI